MKVLITGGAGFIGSHIADKLDCDVVVIDNLSTGKNINPSTIFHRVDVCHFDDIFKWFKPDIVVHAAASYKNHDAWNEDARTNILGTLAVLRLAKRYDAKRLIYFQTSLCYDDSYSPLTVDTPLLPKSSYAITKTAAEHYIKLSGLDYVSFRMANIYGPRNLSGPIPTFYQRLTSSKPCYVMNTRRDFVYIDDLVKLVLQAIQGQGSGVYHVGTGLDYSIKQVYNIIATLLGKPADVEVRDRGEDDVYSLLLDVSKTHEEFGWQATTLLSDGLKTTLEWYQQNEIEETYTHLRIDD